MENSHIDRLRVTIRRRYRITQYDLSLELSLDLSLELVKNEQDLRHRPLFLALVLDLSDLSYSLLALAQSRSRISR